MLVNVFHFISRLPIWNGRSRLPRLLGLKVVYEGVHDKPHTATQVAFPNDVPEGRVSHTGWLS